MLFRSCETKHYDRGQKITKEMFDSNSFILAFDLTADQSTSTIRSNVISKVLQESNEDLRKHLIKQLLVWYTVNSM